MDEWVGSFGRLIRQTTFFVTIFMDCQAAGISTLLMHQVFFVWSTQKSVPRWDGHPKCTPIIIHTKPTTSESTAQIYPQYSLSLLTHDPTISIFCMVFLLPLHASRKKKYWREKNWCTRNPRLFPRGVRLRSISCLRTYEASPQHVRAAVAVPAFSIPVRRKP